MKKSIEESSGDGSMEVFVDIVLRSISHSNSNLVKNLGDISTTAAWMDLEKEEQKRNHAAIEMMAETLLYKTEADEAGPHLEDDILRLSIFSSAGGWTQIRQSKVREWTSQTEPYSLLLCRGFCAYFGGLGEALTQIASKNLEVQCEWLLPPGAVFLAECAIRAAILCILSALSNVITWRSADLAVLVPTALTSAHRLEKGLMKFALTFEEKKHAPTEDSEKLDLLKSSHPEFLSLYKTNNDFAKLLLEEISKKDSSRRMDFLDSFDQDLHKWCAEKISVPKTSIAIIQ
jgi:hypothetical protein